MPELPEVETTRRGIEPHVLDALAGRLDFGQFGHVRNDKIGRASCRERVSDTV